MIRAVIFDLGHTLWDIGPGDGRALAAAYAALQRTLAARLGRDDLPEAAAIQEAVRLALQASREDYFLDASGQLDQPPSYAWVDRGCRSLGLALDAALLRELTPPLFATEIDHLLCGDGTVEALRALDARGLRLGCITNTLADSAAIRAMLRRFDIEALMRSVVVSADEGWRKPHRSLFEKALRELDVAAADAIFVGDSPLQDVGGAKACGMHAVLTQQYVARPHEGHRPPPDAIIAHLRELPAIIDRLDAAAPPAATLQRNGAGPGEG
ncbi:MAG: HAD family hydrolase [Dehalococcoidia bacterium]|nr:HAD family hydrolase [Dehalococcoidia bacterium]